jgi:hypothetical protein
MILTVNASIEKENMRVQEVVGSVEGTWTVPVIEVDCNKCSRPVIASLKKKLAPFFQYVSVTDCAMLIL